MEKIIEKLEYDIQKAYLIKLSLCIIAMYISLTLFEKEKPLAEIDKLNNLIYLRTTHANEFLYATRGEDLDSIINVSRNKIIQHILRKYKVKLDWGLYSIKPYTDVYGKITRSSLDSVLKSLTARTAVIYPKYLYNCNVEDSNKSNKLQQFSDSEYFYHNVSGFKQENNNLIIKVDIGRTIRQKSEHLRSNAIIFGESYNLNCSCSQDTLFLNNLEDRGWLAREFPWMSENWEKIKTKKIDEFNDIWKGKISEEGVSELQFEVLGIKGKGIGICYIVIIYIVGVYLYYLSYIYKIKELIVDESNKISFNTFIFFNNIPSIVLKALTLIFIPLLSLSLIYFSIIKSNLLLIIILMTFALSIYTFIQLRLIGILNSD